MLSLWYGKLPDLVPGSHSRLAGPGRIKRSQPGGELPGSANKRVNINSKLRNGANQNRGLNILLRVGTCNKMIMPFGKYKGLNINNVPDNYLKWIAENTIIKNRALKNQIAERLANAIIKRAGELDKHGINLGSRLSR